MTPISFILIICAIGTAGYGITRIRDTFLKTFFFIVLILCTIFFFLVAAGVVGSYPLRIR